MKIQNGQASQAHGSSFMMKNSRVFSDGVALFIVFVSSPLPPWKLVLLYGLQHFRFPLGTQAPKPSQKASAKIASMLFRTGCLAVFMIFTCVMCVLCTCTMTINVLLCHLFHCIHETLHWVMAQLTLGFALQDPGDAAHAAGPEHDDDDDASRTEAGSIDAESTVHLL